MGVQIIPAVGSVTVVLSSLATGAHGESGTSSNILAAFSVSSGAHVESGTSSNNISPPTQTGDGTSDKGVAQRGNFFALY